MWEGWGSVWICLAHHPCAQLHVLPLRFSLNFDLTLFSQWLRARIWTSWFKFKPYETEVIFLDRKNNLGEFIGLKIALYFHGVWTQFVSLLLNLNVLLDLIGLACCSWNFHVLAWAQQTFFSCLVSLEIAVFLWQYEIACTDDPCSSLSPNCVQYNYMSLHPCFSLPWTQADLS